MSFFIGNKQYNVEGPKSKMRGKEVFAAEKMSSKKFALSQFCHKELLDLIFLCIYATTYPQEGGNHIHLFLAYEKPSLI